MVKHRDTEDIASQSPIEHRKPSGHATSRPPTQQGSMLSLGAATAPQTDRGHGAAGNVASSGCHCDDDDALMPVFAGGTALGVPTRARGWPRWFHTSRKFRTFFRPDANTNLPTVCPSRLNPPLQRRSCTIPRQSEAGTRHMCRRVMTTRLIQNTPPQPLCCHQAIYMCPSLATSLASLSQHPSLEGPGASSPQHAPPPVARSPRFPIPLNTHA